MPFENDKTLEDIEQLARRAETNVADIDALKTSTDLPPDLMELINSNLRISEDIIALAENFRNER